MLFITDFILNEFRPSLVRQDRYETCQIFQILRYAKFEFRLEVEVEEEEEEEGKDEEEIFAQRCCCWSGANVPVRYSADC